MKRSRRLERRTELARRTPMRARSPRRLRAMVTRRELVASLLELYPNCLAGLDGCDYVAVDVHEVKSRGRGGSFLDPDNCLTVCRPCHDWITQNPAEAERLGLLQPSTDECRLVRLPTGDLVRMHGGAEPSPESLDALVDVVAAGRRRMADEAGIAPELLDGASSAQALRDYEGQARPMKDPLPGPKPAHRMTTAIIFRGPTKVGRGACDCGEAVELEGGYRDLDAWHRQHLAELESELPPAAEAAR